MELVGMRKSNALSAHDHSSTGKGGASLKPVYVDIGDNTSKSVPLLELLEGPSGLARNAESLMVMEKYGGNTFLEFITGSGCKSGLYFTKANSLTGGRLLFDLSTDEDRFEIWCAGSKSFQFDWRGNIAIGTGIGPTAHGGFCAIAVKSHTAPTGSIVDGAILYVKDILPGNAIWHLRCENGDIIKFYKQGALTGEDITTVDETYGVEEASVINNIRTRLHEMEDALQNLGLLT